MSHGKNFAGTPLVKRGRQLFFEKACYGCHRIEGLSAGTLGPDLTEVGKRAQDRLPVGTHRQPTGLQRRFVHAAVQAVRRRDQGAGDLPEEPPRHELRRNVDRAVTGRGCSKRSSVSARASAAAGSVALAGSRGEQLIARAFLPACHKLGDHDGASRPDLSYEGLIRDDTWLMDHFRIPALADSGLEHAGVRIPRRRLSLDMTAYLLTRNDAAAHSRTPKRPTRVCAPAATARRVTARVLPISISIPRRAT